MRVMNLSWFEYYGEEPVIPLCFGNLGQGGIRIQVEIAQFERPHEVKSRNLSS